MGFASKALGVLFLILVATPLTADDGEVSAIYAIDIEAASGGGFWLTGKAAYNTYYRALYVARIGDDGAAIWETASLADGEEAAEGAEIAEATDGGAWVVGVVKTRKQPYGDAFVARTEPDGSFRFRKSLAIRKPSAGSSVIALPEGGAVVVRTVSGTLATMLHGPGKSSLIWLNPDGEIVRSIDYDMGIKRLRPALDGGYWALADREFHKGSRRLFRSMESLVSNMEVARFDPDGQVLFKKTYPLLEETVDLEMATAILPLENGGALISGVSIEKGNFRPHILQLEEDGRMSWATRLPVQDRDRQIVEMRVAENGEIEFSGSTFDFEEGSRDPLFGFYKGRLSEDGASLIGNITRYFGPPAAPMYDVAFPPADQNGLIGAGYIHTDRLADPLRIYVWE